MSKVDKINELSQRLAAMPRPQLANRHSNSVPTTPLPQNRTLSFGARSPSPNKRLRNGSPKSIHSQAENGVTRARAKAPSITGCRFETAMAHYRRRIPYAIGGDLLERPKTMPKKFLNPKEEEKLSGDMRELYDRLLPSEESNHRRTNFIKKLEVMLNRRWPGSNTKVFVFGSSGNQLCTSDSDVDICITTDDKKLEKTCLLAEALAEDGMQRVICVPHAKVPIVKFWDPETNLACDMNVNNTLALENTRMIKTYVQIDERVRPLAMIVKHWTKQRVLNDAALGGTLSSYAWICMILNFLQTRNPPILPSLHEKAPQLRPRADGRFAAFNDDLDSLRGFGKANKETLGELLFQFFRRYAHDVDYEKNVISVREGRLISKEGKKWHLMQNNRLCIEEPFNIERNLGNTADDISFRGIHLELRKAFDLIAEARLDDCLEAFIFPTTEERIFERPTPKPPPVLSRSRSQSQSSRGKGGYGNRGGRQQQQSGQSKGRRASSAAATNKYPQPPNGVAAYVDRPVLTHEQAIQAQFDQLKLHRQLFDEMQTLQRQEYELRLKQFQNQLQAELEMQASGQLVPNGPQSAREQLRNLPQIPQVPMSAPMRSNQHFGSYMYPQVPGTPPQNVHTQPSSPSLRAAQPDLRRSMHRSSAADGYSNSNVRSHSQPARGMPTPPNPSSNVPPPLPMNSQQVLHYQHLRQYQMQQEHVQRLMMDAQQGFRSGETTSYGDSRRPGLHGPFEEGTPKEYAGYLINDFAPSHTYRDDYRVPRYPHQPELYPRVRGVPPPMGPAQGGSRSPSPSAVARDRAYSTQSMQSVQSASSNPSVRSRYERVPGTSASNKASGPIIMNGTDALGILEPASALESSSRTPPISEATSGSDEHGLEALPSKHFDPYYHAHLQFEEGFALDQARHLYHHQPPPERLPFTNLERQYMEPSSRRLSTQHSEAAMQDLGLKPVEKKSHNNRGLNIQFGELDYPRSQPKAEQSRPPTQESVRSVEKINGNTSAPSIPSTANGKLEKAQTPAPLLSPVREVRTPSPAGQRKEQPPPQNLAKLSAVNRAGRMDLRIPTWADIIRAKEKKEQELSQASPQESKSNGIPQSGTNGQSPSNPATSKSTDAPALASHGPSTSNAGTADAKHASSNQASSGWQQQASRKHKKTRSRAEVNHGSESFPAHDQERKGG